MSRTRASAEGTPAERELLIQSVSSSSSPHSNESTGPKGEVFDKEPSSPSSRYSGLHECRWALIGVMFFVASLVFFYLSFRDPTMQCTRRLSAYSPAIEGIEYKDVKFKGSLHDHSIYQGSPSPEIDTAWDRISDLRPIRISEADLAKIGKEPRPSMVKYHEEFGGGYLATLEIAHYMHCLNMLRKRTYWEHYGPLDDTYQRDPDFYRVHLDHCIDLLRQTLMCSADVGLITFDWVAEKHTPWPNFSTMHRCRSFEKVVEWNEAHAVTITPSQLTRTNDTVDLPEGP